LSVLCVVAVRRRKFVELEDNFTVECGEVLLAIAEWYRIESETEGMTDEQHWKHYQANSGPVLKQSREWIEGQFRERKVEPTADKRAESGVVGRSELLEGWAQEVDAEGGEQIGIKARQKDRPPRPIGPFEHQVALRGPTGSGRGRLRKGEERWQRVESGLGFGRCSRLWLGWLGLGRVELFGRRSDEADDSTDH